MTRYPLSCLLRVVLPYILEAEVPAKRKVNFSPSHLAVAEMSKPPQLLPFSYLSRSLASPIHHAVSLEHLGSCLCVLFAFSPSRISQSVLPCFLTCVSVLPLLSILSLCKPMFLFLAPKYYSSLLQTDPPQLPEWSLNAHETRILPCLTFFTSTPFSCRIKSSSPGIGV